jgi:hypothetical protein
MLNGNPVLVVGADWPCFGPLDRFGSASGKGWSTILTHRGTNGRGQGRLYRDRPRPPDARYDTLPRELAAQALFELSGVVVRATGEPVANATVLVTPNHSGAEPPVSVPDRVKTAADGTFVIRQLSRGDYVLRAAAAVVSPSDNPDQQSIRYMASSPAAQGGPLVTETAGGFTSEYRFDPIGGVALSVRNGDISGIRLVVSR